MIQENDMKNRIAEKDGATIIFAIAVFLVATVLSISIVGAALNSAKAAARQNDNRQAKLAVSSAASYVKRLFDGCSYSYAPTSAGRDSYKYIVKYAQADGTESEMGKLSVATQNEFKTFIKNSVNGRSANTLEWYMTSDITENDADPLKVKVVVMMNTENVDNNIKVVISDMHGNTTVSMLFVVTVSTSSILSSKKDYTWSYSAIGE